MKLFISYASEDIDEAQTLYRDLTDANLNPWIDKNDLVAGTNWSDELTKNIQNSDIFLALISSSSTTKRGEVQREIRIALTEFEKRLDDDIFIIPIRLDDSEAPEKLKKYQWLDFHGSGFLRKLLISVKTSANKLGKHIDVDNFISDKILVDIESANEVLKENGRNILDVEGYYPIITSGFDPGSLNEINTIIASHVKELVIDYRSKSLDDAEFRNTDLSEFEELEYENYLNIEYNICHISDSLISISFISSFYNVGAAHPNSFWSSINFFTSPVSSIEFNDIFDVDDNPEFVDLVLSKIYDDLKGPDENLLDGESFFEFKEGILEPPKFRYHRKDKKMFIDKDGVTILFDPYEVLAYVYGPVIATIDWPNVQKYSNKHSRSWREIKKIFQQI